jgi:hypothetical protein
MRKTLGWLSILAWAALWLQIAAAQDQAKTAPAKKTAPVKSAKKSSAGKSGTKTKTASKPSASSSKSPATAAKSSAAKSSSTKSGAKSSGKKSSKSGKKAGGATWRNRQTQPSEERYKQIQDALAAKGFLDPADAGGKWGQSSMDALKRFQASQNIDATGKVDSLSLIALGLGPKHDDAPAKPPATPPPAQ